MTNPNEILPGVIFYSYLAKVRKEKVAFFEHSTLVLQVSGHFLWETEEHIISMKSGEMTLIRKNQLGQITKTPVENAHYETIIIVLQEDLLRQMALEEQLEVHQKYVGPPNIHIPYNDFLQGFFQSIVPYVRNPEAHVAKDIGLLKVKEAVKLLLHIMPELRSFLFDFSEPYKIDLERFMMSNYHFNLTTEKFAQLTGRSLSSFKRDFKTTFNASPRQWLQEKRLTQAKHLIETKHLKPSEVYIDIGFETLSHFSYAFKKKFGKAPSEFL